MDSTACLTAGPEKQCYTISPKVTVQWDSNVIYCGFRTAYEVTLRGVTGNALVRIFCRTNKGELLDESVLNMGSSIFTGRVLIPFNIVAGTGIYIEIQLPQYGVMCKSVCMPVHNSIPASAVHLICK